jgi:hypothetical protein
MASGISQSVEDDIQALLRACTYLHARPIFASWPASNYKTRTEAENEMKTAAVCTSR